MPQIRILKNTICGKKFAKAGDVVDASDADAATLIAMKKAEPVRGDDPPKPKKAGSAGPAEGREARDVKTAATVKKEAKPAAPAVVPAFTAPAED